MSTRKRRSWRLWEDVVELYSRDHTQVNPSSSSSVALRTADVRRADEVDIIAGLRHLQTLETPCVPGPTKATATPTRATRRRWPTPDRGDPVPSTRESLYAKLSRPPSRTGGAPDCDPNVTLAAFAAEWLSTRTAAGLIRGRKASTAKVVPIAALEPLATLEARPVGTWLFYPALGLKPGKTGPGYPSGNQARSIPWLQP